MSSTFKISFFSLFLLCSTISIAQNSGFIGRKTFISADVRAFMPMLYNWVVVEPNGKYKAAGTDLKPARNLLSSGMNFTLGRAFDNKVALLVQGSFFNYKVANGESWTPNNNVIIRSTFFRAQSIGIMPILEITGSDGLSPLGLSHQIGIGFYRHKMLDKDYLVYAQGASGVDIFSRDNVVFFDYDQKVKSISLMYKLNLRIPISRRLLYNFGVRYNLNITDFGIAINSSNSTNFYTRSETSEMIRRAQLNNLISFETGLSFML